MKRLAHGALALAAVLIVTSASGEPKYGPGVTDRDIKIGNIAPYSGPASAYSVQAKTQDAYFRMINKQGGVNGRQIVFLSYDDAFSPPKTVEQARRLVEQDDAFVIFNSIGSATNSAIHKYLNTKKVPQIFVSSGATKWNDPKNFPWTMGWQPNYQSEGRVYAKYLLKEHPGKTIGILYQNDDFGKDLLKGFKEGLQDKVSLIVSEQTYDISDPTIDSQFVRLKAAKPDVLLSITSPKFGAQGLKKAAELGWKPIYILSFISSSISATIKPVGLENAQGVLSSTFIKDAADTRWKDDPGIKDFNTFMSQYYPEGDKADASAFYGYGVAQALIEVLKRCGDDLTRENFMRQAQSFHDFRVNVLLPGITINTSATRHQPLDQLMMQRLSGDHWEIFGDVYEGGLSP